jgi:hypothetical protein
VSKAQEDRRADAWKTQHGGRFEQSIKELQEMKAKLDATDPSAPEYAPLKAQYDERYEAEQAHFVKYYESDRQ